ncbi:Proline dehydrogenase [Yarrowia sp. B02]|nr:Proline dehydrogenase [Yarrowia sp. B02]
MKPALRLARFIRPSSVRPSMVLPSHCQPTAVSDASTTFSSSPRLLPPNAEPRFLKNMSTGDVMALGLASLMTCRPFMVKLCAKMLPYVPNSVVKMVVYRLYCGGTNHHEVLQTAQKLQKRGLGVMINYSVERSA